METITKQTREVGTSAGVLLPRSWLNKQVVVTLFEPSKEKILEDIMNYLFEHDLNEEVKGVYLYGSYARGDFDFNSDIDVLIITQNTNKLIKYNNYEILLVSESSFSKNLSNNLNYLSILKEMKVILNKQLIERYKLKEHNFNIKKNISEIVGVFKINQDSIKMCKDNNLSIPDGVVYSIVLRLRELYLIKCFLSKKSYSKKEFLKLIGDKTYSVYLRIKRNEKELNNILPDELMGQIELYKKWLKELKEQKKGIESLKKQVEEHFNKIEADIRENNLDRGRYHIKEIDKSLLAALEIKLEILGIKDDKLVESYRERLEKLRKSLDLG